MGINIRHHITRLYELLQKQQGTNKSKQEKFT